MKGLSFMSPVTERHVQAIWYDRTLRTECVVAENGEDVRIVDPGAWNLEAGPDFRNAVLEVGNRRGRIVGDVEVHLRPSDWTAHGHSADSAYSNVVAHVTWRRESPENAPRLPAGCLRICLGDAMRTDPAFSPDEIDLEAYPYSSLPATPRPCEGVFAKDPDLALFVLRAAGERRMEMKAGRFKALFIRRHDRTQVFYEEFLGAFGYKYNSLPFRELARVFPWTDLPNDFDGIRSALLCAAQMSVARSAPWRRSNVRPVNSPIRRIEAAADLFAGGVPHLLSRLSACNLASRSGQKAAIETLTASRRLGSRRAAAILANVLVPMALAERRLAEVPCWMFPEDVCSPMRLTAWRMLGRDHNPAVYSGNGLYLQGLLQIHKDFCLSAHRDCSECALVRHVVRLTSSRPGS